MQVWIEDWVDKKMPLPTLTDGNTPMEKLRNNFYWWLDWWDSSRPRTGTYESSVLATCLDYAKQDLFNNKVR